MILSKFKMIEGLQIGRHASAVSCLAPLFAFLGHNAFYLSGATRSYVIETVQLISILGTDHTGKGWARTEVTHII